MKMKKKELDWNFERYRTRDLLLEYDDTEMPPRPRVGGIFSIYPREFLHDLMLQNNFEGTIEDFQSLFSTYANSRHIIFAKYSNFPEEGNSSNLYFDTENKILYYWDNNYIPASITG